MSFIKLSIIKNFSPGQKHLYRGKYFKVNYCKEKIKLTVTLYGDKVDYKKQELRVDPKAVTMHKFMVKKEKKVYVARVVVDI